MISYLKGIVLHRAGHYAVLQVGDVGYKVFLPEGTASDLSNEVVLYTHEVVREDTRELFGFFSLAALEMFWKLTSVSSVGPKSAQKIVFAAPVEEVKQKVMEGNITFLTQVPGIGKKTAQKIILELKGALVEEPLGPVANREALEALVGLGYPRRQAQEVLVGMTEQDTEACIRAALKVLSR